MAYKPTEEQKAAAAEKRANLSALSQIIRFLIDLGQIESTTINAGLIEYYRLNDNLGEGEFNTFNQWKELGAFPVKGSKAYMVWSAPLGKKDKDGNETTAAEPTAEDAKKEFTGFATCYLFHESQVEFKGEKPETTKTERQQREPETRTSTEIVVKKEEKPKYAKGSVEAFFLD